MEEKKLSSKYNVKIQFIYFSTKTENITFFIIYSDFFEKLFIFKRFLSHLVNIHYIYYKEFSYIIQKNIFFLFASKPYIIFKCPK